MVKEDPAAVSSSSVASLSASSRRLGRIRLGTSGLVLVGGGIVAWQAYNNSAAFRGSGGGSSGGGGKECGVCGGAGPISRPLSSAAAARNRASPAFRPSPARPDRDDAQFVPLPPAAAERLLLAPPDLLDAREDLRSIVLPKHLRRPWKLLRQANWGDYEAHLRAVRELSRHSAHLGDGECRQLAQSCRRRAAVGLARTEGADLRLFVPAPPLPASVAEEDLPALFRRILSDLPRGGKNKTKDKESEEEAVPECVTFFTDAALESYVPGADDDSIRDSDLDLEFARESHHLSQLPRRRYSERELATHCLRALLSHSALRSHALRMAAGECLPALDRVARQYAEDPHIVSLVGKILSNLAMHEETHDRLFAAGWVGVLARWKRDSNLLVTLPATKALCNMDQSFSGGEVYRPGVYLLLPEDRTVRHLNDLSNWGVDVVFVHGLLGGVFYTWRQLDEDNSRGWGDRSDLSSTEEYSYCWPRDWLRGMSPHVRVIGVDFDTHLSQWGREVPQGKGMRESLEERSNEILDKLQAAGVGRRPVVFVGHSMGGLIIKRLLTRARERAAEDSDSEADRLLADNARGVVFYSTPHLGSRVAKLNAYSKYLFFPSTEVQDLEAGSPQLADLHCNFVRMAKEQKIKVISFGETVPTPYMGLDFTFVPPESSRAGVGQHFDVDMNHMNICKPGGRESVLFRKLQRMLWETLDEATPFE